MSYSDIYKHYPKFHVAVDCVILCYEEKEIRLLLYPRGFEPLMGKWSLMGGFMLENESASQAANRVLKKTVGLENIFMEQLNCFSSPDRDPGGRVVSIAFYALIRADEYSKDSVRLHGGHWWPISKLPELVFDHKEMINTSLERLRQKASSQLVGKELLPNIFTLTQLHNLYTAIFQREFDPGNFRKKISSLEILEKLNTKDTTSSKRGAYYYKFKENPAKGGFERIVKY